MLPIFAQVSGYEVYRDEDAARLRQVESESTSMRILITPIAIPAAESHGGWTRVRALLPEIHGRGHKVAFCAAEDDPNYKPIDGIRNFPSPLPSLFGLPPFLGKPFGTAGAALGVQERVAAHVSSFEQALHRLGAIDAKFFPRDVECLRQTIKTFQPNVIITEHRIASIVAAKLENVLVLADYAYPLQPTFASCPKYGSGVRSFLKRYNLPPINSVLELFDWADLRFVASSIEIEPISGSNLLFVGPLHTTAPPVRAATCLLNRILILTH